MGRGGRGDSEGPPLARRVPRMRGVGIQTPSIFRWPFPPRGGGRHGGEGRRDGWARAARVAHPEGEGADAPRKSIKGPRGDGRGEDGEIPVRAEDRAQRGL